MDVFRNPVTLQYLKSLDPGSKTYRDDRYMDGIYLALQRLSVVVKQPMDIQSIVVESSSFAFSASLRENKLLNLQHRLVYRPDENQQ